MIVGCGLPSPSRGPKPGSIIPDMGTMDSELVVQGVGEVRVMPDLASVRVSIDGEGQSRDDAYQRASASSAAVDAVLSSFEAAVDRVSTAALTVQPKTRWRKGESQRTGWQASRVSVVEITDTSRVGELLNALAGAGASISGLSWMVAPANASFALARQRAGEDARARAEQYAQALNVKLGPVAWAAEPGLRSTQSMGGAGAMFAGAMGGGPPEKSINADPEEVTITAALEVGYRIPQAD